MLTRREKIVLSLLVALFVALTAGSAPVVLDWWCAAFPGQSPLPVGGGEEAVYGLWVLEVLRGVIG